MNMKTLGTIFLVLLSLFILAACGGGGGQEAAAPAEQAAESAEQPVASGGQPEQAVEDQPGPDEGFPEDIPQLPNPENMRVEANGTYIYYETVSTVEEAYKYYDEELAAKGWERINKQDSGFETSITLLRSRPEHNVTITIQAIPDSDKVRVLISLIPK
jgi:hypothetical protein